MIIIMSRHAKRLSVFDRLGPGNDEELTPPYSSATSSSRHRHYSAEKHERSQLTLSADRDKRVSDSGGDRLPRKHRHLVDDDTTPLEVRPSKRDKTTPTIRKDLKVAKPLRGGGGGSSEEQGDEQTRLKRKRERESLSDSESYHRDTKRPKTESSLERHHSHRDSKGPDKKDPDNLSHQSTNKRLTLSSDPSTEADYNRSELDWSVLSTLPRPKPSLTMSCLEKHHSGSILSDVGVSSLLAGPLLIRKAVNSVRHHLQKHYSDSVSSELIDEPFGGCELAGLGVSHLRTGFKNVFEIGSCRRALTSRMDFMLRKKCFRKFGPKENDFAGCFLHFYPASIRLYKS